MRLNNSYMVMIGSVVLLGAAVSMSCKPRRGSSLSEDGSSQLCSDIGPSLGIELLKKEQYSSYPYADYSSYIRTEDKNLDGISIDELLVRAIAPISPGDKKTALDMFFYPAKIRLRTLTMDGSQAPSAWKEIAAQPGISINRVWVAPTQTYIMLLLNDGQRNFLRTYPVADVNQLTTIAGSDNRVTFGNRKPVANIRDVPLNLSGADIEAFKSATWYDGALAWLSASGTLQITNNTVTFGQATPQISSTQFAERTNEQLRSKNVRALHAASLADGTMLIVGSGLAAGADRGGSLQLYAMSFDKGLNSILDLKGVGTYRPNIAISNAMLDGTQYFTIEHVSLDNRIRLKLYYINTRAQEVKPELLGDVSTGLSDDRSAKRAALMFEKDQTPILLVNSANKRMRIDVGAIFRGKQYNLKQLLGVNIESRFGASAFDAENAIFYVATSQGQLAAGNVCLSAKQMLPMPEDPGDKPAITVKAMKVVTGSFNQQLRFLLMLTTDGRIYRYDLSSSRIGIPPQNVEAKLLMDFGREIPLVDFGQAHGNLESKGFYCYIDGAQLWRYGFPCESDPGSLSDVPAAIKGAVANVQMAPTVKIFDSIGGSFLNHYVLKGNAVASLAYADKRMNGRQLRFDSAKNEAGAEVPVSALSAEHVKDTMFLLTRPLEAEQISMPAFSQICESHVGKENTRYLFNINPDGSIQVGYNDEMGDLHGFVAAKFAEGTLAPKMADFRCFDSFKENKGIGRFIIGSVLGTNLLIIQHGDLDAAAKLKVARALPRINPQPDNTNNVAAASATLPRIRSSTVIPVQIGETYDLPVVFTMYDDLVMQINSFQPQLDLYLE